jgi:hypothetical protein
MYADEMGDVIDFPGLELVGAVAGEVTPQPLSRDDCISAPNGRCVAHDDNPKRMLLSDTDSSMH